MNTNNKLQLGAMMLFLALFAVSGQVFGDPTGAVISNNSTDTGPTASPDNRSDARATITTMVLNSTQQDQFWKGYVGNVSGSLSLDDASSNTIYDWALTSVSGQVYATRASSIDSASFNCTISSDLATENTFHNMTAVQLDNVNSTFNDTGHSSFVVGGVTIDADTCPSQALFTSDTREAASSSATWQEIVIKDNAGSVLYTTIINDDATGFDAAAKDFQLIVPESNVKASPTVYYFYLELG